MAVNYTPISTGTAVNNAAATFNAPLQQLDDAIVELQDVSHSIQPGTMQGRLTLSSTLPVTTTDVTAATTLYLLPFKGNKVALYNITDAIWEEHDIPAVGVNIAIPATTDTNYDVYLYDNAGTLTLELVAWSSATARATALTTQDGAEVKTGTLSKLYVGTIRTTTVSGQCEDSITKRYVWNNYNRKLRALRAYETTDSWAYATTTLRGINNGTAARVQFVIGLSEEPVRARVNLHASGSTANVTPYAGIGLDSTSASSHTSLTATSILSTNASARQPLVANYEDYIAIGYHYLQGLEQGNTNTTFYGDDGGALIKSGIEAVLAA